MNSVNSISGGKTSAYMAIHYPADVNVFALVKTTDVNAISQDKGLIKQVQARIPDFIASRELDSTLIEVLNLEQKLGNKIEWVSAKETFDDLINRKKMLPNSRMRFCTVELKLKPIFEFCYQTYGLTIMNIGFRFDEKKRANRMLENCDRAYYFTFKNKKYEWRIPNFPLIENKVTHKQIIEYWNANNNNFPTVSNCDYCFFHQVTEQRQQLANYPDRVKWWADQEQKINHTFAKTHSFSDIIDPEKSIKELPLFSCNCTD